MKLRSTWPAFAALLGLMLLLACGGDDSPSTTAPPEDTSLTESEEATAATIIDAVNAVSQVGNLVLGVVRDLRPGGKRQEGPPVDPQAAAETCPAVSVNSEGLHSLTATMDFGAGCTTHSGFAASGALIVDWRGGGTVDTVTVAFSGFEADSSLIDGTLSAVGRGNSWTLSFDGTIVADGVFYDLQASLGFAFDNHGTPGESSDDETTVTGHGTLSTGGRSYELSVTSPLVFVTDCAYPISGALTYQEQSDGPLPAPVYTIDFSQGDCCTARVSVGNRHDDLDLCVSE